MCSIAGIYNLNESSIDLENLKKFTNSMQHRGPDGAGYELYNNNCLGFGHRRLSILDLSEAGKQPFSYLNRYHITYNGEVYNFIEIRNELKTKGYSFKTETDTEVILAAYHEYGKDCLLKFNGMWAFAIWDELKNELFLARDRFGVKPLHYSYKKNNLFAFASETIAFKYINGFNRKFNQHNLAIALQNPSIIEAKGQTIFEEINQLLPGHTLTLSNNKELKIERWWNTADHLIEVSKNYNEQVQQFKSIFFDACKLRMRSDVSIASALSGGIDSSSVYCTLQQFKTNSSDISRLPNDWQKAFVATFPGTTMDERDYAEQVIKHTNGKAVFIQPDYSNLVSEITKTTILLDAIISNPIIAITDIYKAMRNQGITVSLDGHGADEYAFGYNSYALQNYYEALKNNNKAKAIEMIKILSGLSKNYNTDNLIKQFDNYNSLKSKLKRTIKNTFLNKPETDIKQNNSWFNETYIKENLNFYTNPFNGVSKTLFDDFHYYSLPINLRDFDRAAMQNSVEIRMPFMDYRLVQFMFSLPEESKLGGGYTKRIIRDAMKNILPDEIRTRTLKIGIGSPIVEWIKEPLKEFVNDQLHSQKMENLTFLNSKQIQNDINKLYKNNTWNVNNASETWSIVNALLINE
ncbi:MAG: asparagine synthase (glutamine-hydrolyzing) [Bacteroidia bacterium]